MSNLTNRSIFQSACIGLFVINMASAPKALAVTQGHPAFESGNSLLHLCESVGESAGACSGFMVATVDILNSYPEIASRLNVCMPREAPISIRQIKDIGISYLRSHPENRHYTATSNIVLALERSQPD